MLEELAWTQQLPALAHLLGRDDVPRKEHHLPRPLTPEQDQLIQQELLRRNDFVSNVLLLLRHTGMRIGECVDLSVDCLRTLGPNQWAIQVPLGKLKTERWVPVDSQVCQLIERIRSLRPPTAPKAGRLLLPRPRGRCVLIRKLRAALQEVVSAVGIPVRIVPHQFRHYAESRTMPNQNATTWLRACEMGADRYRLLRMMRHSPVVADWAKSRTADHLVGNRCLRHRADSLQKLPACRGLAVGTQWWLEWQRAATSGPRVTDSQGNQEQDYAASRGIQPLC